MNAPVNAPLPVVKAATSSVPPRPASPGAEALAALCKAAIPPLLGIALFGIGLLGEYIGRIFEEVKRRPVYIVAEEAGLGLPRRRQRASVADLTGANTAQPDLPDELPPGVTWQ